MSMHQPFVHLPADMLTLTQWCTHANKRPSIDPDKAHLAWSFDIAKSKLNGRANLDSTVGLGIILSKQTPLSVIDVDFMGSTPGSEEEKKEKIALSEEAHTFLDWSSKKFADWLLAQPYMQEALNATGFDLLILSSYTEVSPTGTGLHIWLNTPDKLDSKKAYASSSTPGYKGQWSWYNAFMTCTGIPLHNSPSKLATIKLPRFSHIFGKSSNSADANQLPPPKASSRDDNNLIDKLEAAKRLPHLSEVLDALTLLPATPTQQLAQSYQAATGQTYEHYKYWMMIGMALHDYGQQTGQLITMFEAYLEWSKKDTQAFKSDEDVEAHWKSFSTTQDAPQITIATLIYMAKAVVLQYPRPIYKDGKATRNPKINEYINFQYLMDRYNIRLYNDHSGASFVSGDKDIMQRYFQFPSIPEPVLDRFYGPFTTNGLVTATTQLCQNASWQQLQNTKNLVTQWSERALQLDTFQEWLDTPYEQLPERYRLIRTAKGLKDATNYDENSTAEYLFDCMRVVPRGGTEKSRDEEIDLYYACLEKTLYHVIKYREPSIRQSYRNDSGGMLILVGPEHTYKSTFCRMLLPLELQYLRKEVNTQVNNTKAERDFIRYLASRVIVQIDEFEGMMNMKSHSSFFKNLLSSDSMSQVDIYSTTETEMKRKAIIIATTNEVQHVLSREGSRRLWFIPTGVIDTNKALLFNHHKFYNNLRKSLQEAYNKNKLIWQFTKEQSALRSAWNSSYSASSSLATMLEETWPFTTTDMPEDYLDGRLNMREPKDRGTKLMRTGEIAGILQSRGANKISLAALKHELTKYCSIWTGTQNQDKTLKKLSNGSVTKIIKGKACQNWYEPKKGYQYEYWVMPPLIDHMSPEMYPMADDEEE